MILVIIEQPCVESLAIGALVLKLHCTDRSVYDIKVPRERFKSIRSHLPSSSTLMSHTDKSDGDDPLQVEQA